MTKTNYQQEYIAHVYQHNPPAGREMTRHELNKAYEREQKEKKRKKKGKKS